MLGIVATGLAVEIALMPIALYHFHRSGLYGVGANIIAIPLTTFVIMPLEAGALVPRYRSGWRRPFWFLCGPVDRRLAGARPRSRLGAGRRRAAAVDAGLGVRLRWSAVASGCACGQARVRLLGLVPIGIGAVGAALAPSPDLLVTGDGRHLAVVENGTPLILRDRAGDYVRSLLAEASGFDGDPDILDGQPASDCSHDACVALLRTGRHGMAPARHAVGRPDRLGSDHRRLRVGRTSSSPTAACRAAASPRWLKLDAEALGADRRRLRSISATRPRIDSVADQVGAHPWARNRAAQ